MSESDLQARLDALASQLGGTDKLPAWESAHGYTQASFAVALKRADEAAFMRDKIVTAVPRTADQVHVQQILFYNESDARRVLKPAGGRRGLRQPGSLLRSPHPRRAQLVPEGLPARAQDRRSRFQPGGRRC